MEPRWGIVGQITFRSGCHSYFRYNTLDLNPVGSSDIARDKDFSNFFMKKMDYPIVPGSKTFFSKHWGELIGSPGRNINAAYQYARRLRFPVIVKPNSGTQGIGVSLVYDKKEFYRAMRAIFSLDKVALVQKQVLGKDYRLVVLDKKIISAYERIPLNVVGDGESTVKQLLNAKQKKFIASSRDTQINVKDPRIQIKLKHQKLNFRSVAALGQKVYLLDNANLSTGGDSLDVTGKVHKFFVELAVNLTRDMGLRLCGVDLMIDGDISEKTDAFYIIEINAAPGLDHYVKMGKMQEKIVEDLYSQVLKNMEH
jgi:D-alanine-D-alanine ligase-like ATP-grasp enzyme